MGSVDFFFRPCFLGASGIGASTGGTETLAIGGCSAIKKDDLK
jgi:hypothetical protein